MGTLISAVTCTIQINKMVKFTPLALAGLVACTQALNVNEFLQDALERIYTKNGNVETISLEPYFQVVTTTLPNERGFDMEGSWGMGKGDPIVFTRKIRTSNGEFILSTSDSGNFDNTFFPMIWPELTGHDFAEEWKINAKPQEMEVSLEATGNVAGHRWGMNQAFAVAQFKQGRSGSSVTVHAEGSYEYDAWLGQMSCNWVPEHNYNVDIALQANKRCNGQQGPFTNGCVASVAMTGTADHSISIKASSSKFVVEVASSGRKQHTAKILYNGHNLYQLKHKGRSGGFSDIISLPGPGRFQQIAAAGEAYVAPFVTYATGMVSQPELAPHAIVWADRMFADLDNEFDCSAVVEATGFECPPLAAELGASSMQTLLQSSCATFNDLAVNGLQAAIEPMQMARTYVNDLTDENNGGRKFNAWYSSL